MLLLCYDCNRETRSKLEEENKTNTFKVYLMKNKKTGKQKAYFTMVV